MARCGAALAMVMREEGLDVFPARCGSWDCPHCVHFKLARLREEAICGDPNMFMTLTPSPAFPGTVEECALVMSTAFNKLVKRIKRLLGTTSWPYFLVVERFQSGMPHFHILARSPFIHQAWLSNAWAELTGARVVDIRRVENPATRASYLADYLKKGPTQFGAMKRYRRSQDYLLREPEKAEVESKVIACQRLNGWTLPQMLTALLCDGWRQFQNARGRYLWRHEDPNRRPPGWENFFRPEEGAATRKSGGSPKRRPRDGPDTRRALGSPCGPLSLR